MKAEILRLLSENENLKVKMVEIQRESEDKENELIAEINALVSAGNQNQLQGEEEGIEDETTDTRYVPVIPERETNTSLVFWAT